MMESGRLNHESLAVLKALANGIIPADASDNGAAAVDACGKLAKKIESGVNTAVYLKGLQAAADLSAAQFSRPVAALEPMQIHELLGLLRTDHTAFFKQLRMDVCAIYLSEPAVWERIGFPGPSTESGGYPDFDQPQGAAKSG